MIRKSKTRAATQIEPDWLTPYRERFVKEIAAQGYSRPSIRMYEDAARVFCAEVSRRRLRKGELAGRKFDGARTAALEALHPNKIGHKRHCLERFIAALVEAGVAERAKPEVSPPTPLDRLKAEYQNYLRHQRGATDATAYHCIRFLDRFMTFRFGDKLGRLDDITQHDVVRFIGKLRGGTAPRDKSAPSHLRNMLRFLFWSGKTKRDLAASIPRSRQPARSSLPRYLSPRTSTS